MYNAKNRNTFTEAATTVNEGSKNAIVIIAKDREYGLVHQGGIIYVEDTLYNPSRKPNLKYFQS